MKSLGIAVLLVSLTGTGQVFADDALAKAKNCYACHATDKRLVGPSYKEVAKRYAGKKGAEAELLTSIQKGSMGGKWKDAGVRAVMPPNAVNEAEAKKLVAWILSMQ